MNDNQATFEQGLVLRERNKGLIAISDGVIPLDCDPIPKVGETVKVVEKDGNDINVKVDCVEGNTVTGTIISSCKYDLVGSTVTFHTDFIHVRDNSCTSNFN